MIPTQKSINHHLPASPRHPIIHHQVITSMREIWSPRPPISMSSQSPATGAWAWASLGGGAKKRIACQPIFYFFSRPPERSPGPICWRLRTHCQSHEQFLLCFLRPPLGSGPGAGRGGQKKNACGIGQPVLFFSAPPREKPRPNLLEIEDSLPIPRAICFCAPPVRSGPGAGDSRDYGFHYSYLCKSSNSTITSYIPLVCLKTQLSAPASTCMLLGEEKVLHELGNE